MVDKLKNKLIGTIKNKKDKIISNFKNQNLLGEYYPVSLNEKRRLPLKILFKYIGYGFAVMITCSVFLFDKAPFLSWLLILGYIIFMIKTGYTRIRRRFFSYGKPYEATLRNFIYKNKLYTEFSNGELESEIELGYIENLDTLTVVVIKDGGKYQEMSDKLSERLESALNISFYKKVVEPNYCEYIFRKIPVEREFIDSIALTDNSMKISLYDDICIDLNSNFSTLISGASGGGKSFITYGILAKFAQQTVKRKIGENYYTVHAKLFLIDAKQSDIYKHAMIADFPKENYASDVKGAFAIVKKFTEELEKRKDIYAKSKDFDVTMLKLGYEPQLLVLEEYSSLVSMMQKSQKEDFEKMVGNIARLGRQLSLGVLVIMQQASADSSSGLPTGIKEQLVNKIFMGTPSQQSSMMMFNVGSKELPNVSKVGEGIVAIDNEPISFLAPTFTQNIDKVIQPVLQNAANNYREISQIEELEKTKENADEIEINKEA